MKRPRVLAVLHHLAFDRDDVRQDVAMADHDALRLGGRARREDDLDDVVARDRRRPASGRRRASRDRRTATRARTIAHRPASWATSSPIRMRRASTSARTLQDEVGRRPVVDRDDDDAGEQAAPVAGDPLRTVLAPEHDLVALGERRRRRAWPRSRARRGRRPHRCGPAAGSRRRRRGSRRGSRPGRGRSRSACPAAPLNYDPGSVSVPPALAVGALYDSVLQSALRQFFERASLDTEVDALGVVGWPAVDRAVGQSGGADHPVVRDALHAARAGALAVHRARSAAGAGDRRGAGGAVSAPFSIRASSPSAAICSAA